MRHAATDRTGLYRFAELVPAVYDVTATAPGFAELRQPPATLEVASAVRLDFRLAIGPITARVEVVGTATPAPTETIGLGTLLDRRRIASLPLNRRDFLQLALLAPGVAPPVEESELSSRGAFAMHAGGGREEFNNYLLDGVDNNDPYVRRYVVQPSVEGIQEFRIATNGYGAEYGNGGAGQVNVITRSGTNRFDLSAYEFFRDKSLDARNAFDGSDKPAFNRNQFGGGAGGPVTRDRTFFFASVDWLRERRGISRLGTVPSPAVRSGDLSSLGVTIVDPFTRAPFSGGVIPTARLSPVGLKILNLFPAPNRAGTGGNYLGRAVLEDDETQTLARIDHRLTRSDQLMVRYSYGLTDAFEPYAEDTEGLPGFGDFLRDPAHNATLQWQRTIGSGAVNSLRIGYNRFSRELRAENFGTDVGRLWGVDWMNLPERDFGYPVLNVAGFSKLGDAISLPILRHASTFQLTEGLTLARGAHLFQAGGELRHERLDGRLDMLTRGSLSFSGLISGSGLSDLLLGLPSFGLQAKADNPIALRSTAFSVWAQDDWRVRPDLTLNVGLRYEYRAPPADPDNRMSAFDLASHSVLPVGTGSLTRSGIAADRNNVAPRVGVAWSVRPNLTLRGGYGVYYDAGMFEVNSAQYFNPPQFALRVFFPTQYSLLTLSNPFPTNGGYTPPASISTLSPALVTSLLQQWNVTADLRLPVVGRVSVGYAGSKGSHLVRSRDLNQPAPGPGDVQARRPYPSYGGIFYVESEGRSTYHSLQVATSRPLARGVALSAVYTLSSSNDDASAFLGTKGDRNFPQDSRDVAAQWGPSSFDLRHRFAATLICQLPRGHWLTRDTELRGIVSIQSGQPFTPILRFDNSNTGNGGQQSGWDHPNLTGEPTISNPTADRWFDTAAFAVPAPYTFGNAGRNILRGPGFASVDVALARQVARVGGGALSVELQAFNLFNRVNLEMPEVYADEPSTFGRIFAAKAPRQIQIALRAAF